MARSTQKPADLANTNGEAPALEVGTVLDELPGLPPRSFTTTNRWTAPLESVANDNPGKWVVIDMITATPDEDETSTKRRTQSRANQVNQGLKRDRIKIADSLDKAKFEIKARGTAVFARYTA